MCAKLDTPKLPVQSRKNSVQSFVACVRSICAELHETNPARLVFLGYLSYILVGWMLLCVPFLQNAPGVAALDNLFIVTSAVSTTGLVTVGLTESYTLAGQFLILMLIQLGGIGYMTLGSSIILARKNELSPARLAVGHAVFTLPASFRVEKFIWSVVKFTLIIEAAGAAALYFAFKDAGIVHPFWSAAFHSVSAFCTAGFSLYSNSFESFAGHFWINIIFAALSYLGAIGFIVCVDFSRKLRGKVQDVTLTTKIIVLATLCLTAAGTLIFFLIEPSIQQMSPDERIIAAFFQCMTSMTTVGFNTISIGTVSKASVVLIVVLMIIGASPSGTGGGLKVTTATAIFGVMRSALRGDSQVRFWGKIIPQERVLMAVANLGFYLCALAIGVFLLELSEDTGFDANFFEAASALGTVGLSMGATPLLSSLGKTIIILMMFCGRVGPITFGTALLGRRAGTHVQDNDLAI